MPDDPRYARHLMMPSGVYHRAVDARDPRFDGMFFVAITTTGIYCRPICPSRRADPANRRFFPSAAAAEHAGFRPCLRCQPELAPGRAPVDAVSRLAAAAAQRIAAGALNGRSVANLASDLGVTERHLRRAVRRETGVTPVKLAQTHRLLLAKRLLADTTFSMTRVAFASGFQSLRRFNAAFRERYRMSPSAIQRLSSPPTDPIRLTLPYRAPFAWDELTAFLRPNAIPGVELVEPGRYGRTVGLDGRIGFVLAEVVREGQVTVRIAASLVPALMPLLARLRHVFDLDAEPAAVDAQLEQGGLGWLVRRRPGLRLPGAFDGFEVALFAVIGGTPADLPGRVARALGEPVETGTPGLDRLAPTAERVAGVGPEGLVALGVPRDRAHAAVTIARLVAAGALGLEPGGDVIATRRTLATIAGVGGDVATTIAMRALHWPDAFPSTDRALQRAAGAPNAVALRARAERWRPWRAYAALHLWLHDELSNRSGHARLREQRDLGGDHLPAAGQPGVGVDVA